jgi:hypothetical protein
VLCHKSYGYYSPIARWPEVISIGANEGNDRRFWLPSNNGKISVREHGFCLKMVNIEQGLHSLRLW